MTKPRIVIDTNVWISFLFWENPTLIAALRKAQYEYRLICSDPAFDEIKESLYKDKFARFAYLVQDEDIARLSPFLHEHINLLGRYSFSVPEEVTRGELRPLR
ncbi:MAG: putative toxin-antitoxin system toxin component, PIN family, partial [Candidatus Riflebacteria bacterium]|nr:putative toxin-antitoxin system toxin component, PIN family [Candidatus Riflebacteria bacterium]